MEFHSVEEIFVGIEKIRGKIVQTVESLNDDHANFRRAPDKWTIANIVEHLAKTEASIIRAIEKLLAKAEAENVPASGRIEPPVSFVEIGQKNAGIKRTAPEYLVPSGTLTIKESLGELENSRRSLHALRPRLEAVDLSNAQFPHPFFGSLNLYYWIAFIGLHELHHLKQISEALQGYKQSLENTQNAAEGIAL